MRIKQMSIHALILATLSLSLFAAPMPAQAKPPAPGGGSANVTCNLPESNAESLEILSNYYPGYWWDHADLTIAVQAAPNVPTKYLRAIDKAIDTWTEVLEECFDGAITLTNVTNTARNAQKADIVLHYVPTVGGASFDGYAVCGAKDCPNILSVRMRRGLTITARNTWAG